MEKCVKLNRLYMNNFYLSTNKIEVNIQYIQFNFILNKIKIYHFMLRRMERFRR